MSEFSGYIPSHVQHRVKHGLIYLFLLLVLLAVFIGIYRGGVHLSELEANQVTLSELPSALILSFFRMLVSYTASLFFAFFLGVLAAKTYLGEKFIIPTLDVLQSVPVIGFFPAAITFFISVSNGHRIGIELAACFLIFTSQAWNMAFAVYEAIKSIPKENLDAIRSLGVKGTNRFWKLYAPATIPRLVYNSMLSWSNGWYFLVACEIIAVGTIHYHLPRIGSFISRSAEQSELFLVFSGLAALTGLVLILDFLVWRPISIWSQRFRQDLTSNDDDDLGSLGLLPKTLISRIEEFTPPFIKLISVLTFPLAWIFNKILKPIFWELPKHPFKHIWKKTVTSLFQPVRKKLNAIIKKYIWLEQAVFWFISGVLFSWVGFIIYRWLQPPWPKIVKEIPLAILASTGRLLVAFFICLIWIVPLVLLCWNKPKIRQTLTTIAQVGASLPAVAFFPLIKEFAFKNFGTNGMELSCILLLLTGMQWYLLFNCLGGTATIPSDIKEVTRSLGLKKFLTWKRLVLPAIRPSMITGAITAWGGGWNALVVAEYVSYKGNTLSVNGIGALLSKATYDLGDGKAMAICISAMIIWILFLNLLFWKPIYNFSIERFKFDS